MKLFDPYAALAEIEKQGHTPATSATLATQAPKMAPNVAEVASVAAPIPEFLENEPRPPAGDMRHGHAINGHPKTWTGKIVSLDAWRQLSHWERHGPDGRHWSGITKCWNAPKDST